MPNWQRPSGRHVTALGRRRWRPVITVHTAVDSGRSLSSALYLDPINLPALREVCFIWETLQLVSVNSSPILSHTAHHTPHTPHITLHTHRTLHWLMDRMPHSFYPSITPTRPYRCILQCRRIQSSLGQVWYVHGDRHMWTFLQSRPKWYWVL